MLDIQSVEIAARLRRFFGLRGEVRLAADTTLSPTLPVANLDSPPFRTDGVRWWGSRRMTADVGFPSVVFVTAQTGTMLVVDQIHVSNDPANAAPIWCGFGAGFRDFAASAAMQSSEFEPSPIESISVVGQMTAAAAAIPTSVGRFYVPSGATVSFEGMDWRVWPGRSFEVFTWDVNRILNVTMSGRLWSGQP